jgi:hypothetical protein
MNSLRVLAVLGSLLGLGACGMPIENGVSSAIVNDDGEPGPRPPKPAQPPKPTPPPPAPAKPMSVPFTFAVTAARAERTSDTGGEDRDEVYILVNATINYQQTSFRLPANDDYYEFEQSEIFTDGLFKPWTNKSQAHVPGPVFAGPLSLPEGSTGTIEVKVMEQDPGLHDWLGTLWITFTVQNGRVQPTYSGQYPGVANIDPTNPNLVGLGLVGTDSVYFMRVELLQ